jgi:hypothetical protein
MRNSERIPLPGGSGGMLRAAGAGACAALAWAAVEPIDRRIFGCDYSDVALLGKAMTPGRGWLAVGLVLHAANGAVFGLSYAALRQRVAVEPRRLALVAALTEHVALYPLTGLVDRHHPRRGAPGVPALRGNRRAYAQATFRHALFGLVLGRLAG